MSGSAVVAVVRLQGGPLLQICGEMGAVSLLAGEPEGGTHYSALHTKLKLIR